MSPVMVGPLVVLAALLVMPGRLPGERRIDGPAPQAQMASFVARSVRVAEGARERVVAWLLRVG